MAHNVPCDTSAGVRQTRGDRLPDVRHPRGTGRRKNIKHESSLTDRQTVVAESGALQHGGSFEAEEYKTERLVYVCFNHFAQGKNGIKKRRNEEAEKIPAEVQTSF